jgi:hypothetical protein
VHGSGLGVMIRVKPFRSHGRVARAVARPSPLRSEQGDFHLATHPAGLPSTRLYASGNTAFQAKNPLSTGIMCHFGADTGGPLTRLATLQPPPHDDGCKPGYQPAGYARPGWGSHPQDDSSEFWFTSQPPLRQALPGRFFSRSTGNSRSAPSQAPTPMTDDIHDMNDYHTHHG